MVVVRPLTDRRVWSAASHASPLVYSSHPCSSSLIVWCFVGDIAHSVQHQAFGPHPRPLLHPRLLPGLVLRLSAFLRLRLLGLLYGYRSLLVLSPRFSLECPRQKSYLQPYGTRPSFLPPLVIVIVVTHSSPLLSSRSSPSRLLPPTPPISHLNIANSIISALWHMKTLSENRLLVRISLLVS